MHWPVTSPEDMTVLAEINRGASDRALGMIAASLVEIHLTKLIKQAFIAEETEQEFMFRSSGPLNLASMSDFVVGARRELHHDQFCGITNPLALSTSR
jgi:hypothetical protein